MPQQTKTELSNELSRVTNTIENMRKQLKQKKNEMVQEQKQLIDKQAQTISEQNHVIEKQKQQIELKDNADPYQCRMIDQFQPEVGHLRDQNSSQLDNLMGHIIQNSTNNLKWSEPKFIPNFINRNTNHLNISDSTYKKIQQSDISYDIGIHSYPSVTIIDLGQNVQQYSSGAKCQSLIFHAGHNSIDKGVSGAAAASQLCEIVTKAIKKLKPHRVLIS